jgi:hypothetical protein
MQWKIWYEGGSTFSSDQGSPQDSPKFGVLAITQADGMHGQLTLSGGEFYVYRDDVAEWYHCDTFGTFDQLIHYAHCISCIRPGRFTTNQEFNDIQSAAINDKELPKFSTYPAKGRKP